jgi:DNA mismatch endonuclease (patch repair protein)
MKKSDKRSKIMRAVRSKSTGPELLLRKLLSKMGYRYRLHTKSLPGKPDIVFSSRRKTIFVHGCFWHRHPGCPKARLPKSNLTYWEPKLRGNVERDRLARRALRKMKWDVLIVWQCRLKNAKLVEKQLRKFLGSPSARAKGSPANTAMT